MQLDCSAYYSDTTGRQSLFAWLISHQPAVLFSHNKPAINNQPTVLFSQNKSAPAISHQPNEQAVVARAFSAPDHRIDAGSSHRCRQAWWLDQHFSG
jgi:hypothetical protein